MNVCFSPVFRIAGIATGASSTSTTGSPRKEGMKAFRNYITILLLLPRERESICLKAVSVVAMAY
jgi:hypothetical protein